MKRKHYTSLWLLLALALIIITGISFSEDIEIGSYKIKKAPIADLLMEESNNSSQHDNDSCVSSDEIIEEDDKLQPTDSLPQSLFIFGDSMTYNLALRLAQYAKHNGHSIHAVNWDSSNTKIWAESDTLDYFLEMYKPTQVFISLGSNELYFKNPDSRKPFVKAILEKIDTIPYVWIGPPNWKKDTGINDMIENLCKPRCFFRSEGLEFKRKADNIHPTRKSSAVWVDTIARWLPESKHPFVMALPPDTIGKSNPHIIFLKALNK